MKKMSASNLVEALKKEGMHFSSSAMSSEGSYAPADADWNYKDIPHLNELHNLVESIATAIGDDIITTIFMQRLGPLRFPLTVVNYSVGDDSQTYYTTFGPFCLVIETQWTAINNNQTRVVTTYNLGSSRLLKILHRFVHRLLRKNYETLMSADIPMRERRGALRGSGYSFRDDLGGYSFVRTLRIYDDNLIPPVSGVNFSVQLNVSELAEGRTLYGDSASSGLIIERNGLRVSIYNRTCTHEGALLDPALLEGECLRCPWHGRQVKPRVSFELDKPELSIVKEGMSVELLDGELSVLVVSL
jgi:nitrite reductase/ring-hydroxylating ferredoxin subunit